MNRPLALITRHIGDLKTAIRTCRAYSYLYTPLQLNRYAYLDMKLNVFLKMREVLKNGN